MSAMKLEASHIEVMVQMVEQGPLHKQDVIDRLATDTLIREGYLSKIVYAGDDGFIAATYAGQQLYCKKIVGVDMLRLAVIERRKRGVITQCSK
jgi:hypothetical protein